MPRLGGGFRARGILQPGRRAGAGRASASARAASVGRRATTGACDARGPASARAPRPDSAFRSRQKGPQGPCDRPGAEAQHPVRRFCASRSEAFVGGEHPVVAGGAKAAAGKRLGEDRPGEHRGWPLGDGVGERTPTVSTAVSTAVPPLPSRRQPPSPQTMTPPARDRRLRRASPPRRDRGQRRRRVSIVGCCVGAEIDQPARPATAVRETRG